MANNALNYMKDILAAPLGEIISSVGHGVAEAQSALDAGSLAQVMEIYSENTENNEAIALLQQIGYQPTFYVIPETEVEAQISLAISFSETSTGGVPSTSPTRIYAAPVNASVSNKYNLSTQASAKLKFKIVPVPQPGDVSDIRVVPDLVGRVLSEATALLDQLGLAYTYDEEAGVTESSVISDQNVDPGSILRTGEEIGLVF